MGGESSRLSSGGVPARARREVSGGWTDRPAALLLVLCGLPVFLVVGLAIMLIAGRPIFYGGERLGRNKRPFRMFKFRTLISGAEQITGAAVLESPGKLAIPLGKFLRETRLDELPQLFNIVRGEMSFIGPRPVRPQVYEAVCREIPSYDLRFTVRPGLIGVSQLFTPAGTSKRYRTLLDNQWLEAQHKPHGAAIVPFTIWHVARAILRRTSRWMRLTIDTRILRRYSRQRKRRRVTVTDARVSGAPGWSLVDMDEKAFRIRSSERLAELPPTLELELELELDPAATAPRLRRAVCRTRVFARRSGEEGHDTIVAYRPVSERSHYVLHQYFLRDSFAFAPRARHTEADDRRRPHAPLPRKAAVEPGATGAARVEVRS